MVFLYSANYLIHTYTYTPHSPYSKSSKCTYETIMTTKKSKYHKVCSSISVTDVLRRDKAQACLTPQSLQVILVKMCQLVSTLQFLEEKSFYN